MLRQFNHKKTGMPGLFISTESLLRNTELGKHSFKIIKPEDIPDFVFFDHFNMPFEIEKSMGKPGMDNYFKSFINYPKVYYLEFLPHGFPNDQVPIENL